MHSLPEPVPSAFSGPTKSSLRLPIESLRALEQALALLTAELPPDEVLAVLDAAIALKQRAEAALGRPVRDAVITVPAHFSDPQRKAVLAAALMADVPVLGLVEEQGRVGFSANEAAIRRASVDVSARVMMLRWG